MILEIFKEFEITSLPLHVPQKVKLSGTESCRALKGGSCNPVIPISNGVLSLYPNFKWGAIPQSQFPIYPQTDFPESCYPNFSPEFRYPNFKRGIILLSQFFSLLSHYPKFPFQGPSCLSLQANYHFPIQIGKFGCKDRLREGVKRFDVVPKNMVQLLNLHEN